MTVADGISLGITIGLGIVSIILGIFAIWLSHRFAQESTTALSKLKDVSTEIKVLSESGQSHQDKFSSKMLDTIIERSSFGSNMTQPLSDSSELFKEMIRGPLEEIEARITNSLESRLKGLIESSTSDKSSLLKIADEIKHDLRSMVNEASNLIEDTKMPIGLKQVAKKWKDLVGFPVLIALIVNEDASSLKDIEKASSKYNLPKDYMEGLNILIKDNILEGNLDSFSIVPEYKKPLKFWVVKNEQSINALVEVYGKHFDDEEGRWNRFTEIGKELSF